MVSYEPFSDEKVQEIAQKVKYCSNHNHTEISNFRLRDSIIRCNDLIDYAIKLGYNGVTCTDHEALSGHVRLLIHRNELIKDGKYPEDFKLGLGNEIYLIDNIENVTTYYKQIEEDRFWHFILIAKDKEGYHQLKQISSESAWVHWFKSGKIERVPTIKSEMEQIIGDNKGHLIATSACLGSQLDFYILRYLETQSIDYKRKIHHFITWAINLFGKENFFLELQPCILKKDEDGNYIEHDQAKVDQFLIKLAKAYGISTTCATDSHYKRKEDRMIHEAYLLGDDDDKKGVRELNDFYETTYMFGIDELIKTFSYFLTEEEIIDVFNGTQKIHDMIEDYDLDHGTIVPRDKNLPEFQLSHMLKQYYPTHEYIKKFAESDDIQDRYMLYLVEKGLVQKNQYEDSTYHFCSYDYDGKILEEHDKTVTLQEKIDRIDEEFSSFWKISERLNQKLSSYYVLVRGLIHEVMWKVSYVGIARGSVGGSYVAYLMDITQINPMKYDLPFWRHSSPLRPELPD